MPGFAKANTRIGFGQVERNHMSGEVTGRIFAQYPADTAVMGTILENGRFAKYDGEVNKVNLAGQGEWMMIYDEEMLPDERKQNHKDFALKASDYVGGEIVPRLIACEIGDIFTTNTIMGYDDYTVAEINALTDSKETTVAMPAVGTTVYINGDNGYLTIDASKKATDSLEFVVIKPFQATCTMPDGQPAVKLMRTK